MKEREEQTGRAGTAAAAGEVLSAGQRLTADACDRMREKPELLSGVAELAEALGVSKHHLIRTFTKELGTTPGKYLENVRINRAKLILCNSDHSLEATAAMCGYSCANYFCKVFKKAVGQSPGEYRKKQASYVDETTRERLRQIEGNFLL